MNVLQIVGHNADILVMSIRLIKRKIIKTGSIAIIVGLLFAGAGVISHNVDAREQAKQTTFLAEGVSVDAEISNVYKTYEKRTTTGKSLRTVIKYYPEIKYTVERTNETVTTNVKSISTTSSKKYVVGELLPVTYMESNPKDFILTGEYAPEPKPSSVILLYLFSAGLILSGLSYIVTKLQKLNRHATVIDNPNVT